MDKRRKARILSLVLALFMLFAIVPGFSPGGMKAVAAVGYITSVTAETNYGNNVLFNGFPYYINVTVNASQNTFANITLYYQYLNGTVVPVYNRIKPIYAGSNTIIINSTNPVDIPVQYSKIPQNVTQVYLEVYEAVWNSTTGSYQNIPGTNRTFNFNVKFPFTVTYKIQSSQGLNWQAYYWNGTAWADDKAFVGMPFDIKVVIQYNQTLVGSGVQLPAPSNLSVVLVNRSTVTWYYYAGASESNGKIILDLNSYNLSTGQYNFSALELATNTNITSLVKNGVVMDIVVKDLQNNLTNNRYSFHIWPLVRKVTNVIVKQGTTPVPGNVIYRGVPFNITIFSQVFANISGTLTNFTTTATSMYVDTRVYDSYGNVLASQWASLITGAVAGGGTGYITFNNLATLGTYINATYGLKYLHIIPDPYGINPSYDPTIVQLPYSMNPISVTKWKINVTNYNITYNGQLSTYNGKPVFWINVPNPVFNISISYPIPPYLVNSTANISMKNEGIPLLLPITGGQIPVINDNGRASFHLTAFPIRLGNVTVSIWDATYNVTDPFTIPVLDWNVTSTYNVLAYGQYPGNVFYVGVPADLQVNATYTLGILLNSSVVVEVYGPTGTLLANTTIPIVNNHGSAIVLHNVTFNTPGNVTVKVYNTTLGVYTEYTIPIKDWSIYIGTTPTSLILGKPANITVNVGESLQFPGTREVTVTLQVPGNYTVTKNLTLAGATVAGAGGYYGLVSFLNVTPTALGLAKIIVTDVLTGKTAVKYIPVEPNFAVTNTTIDVTATPASSPVYEYVDNSLTIKLQYENIINGTYLTPATTNSIARVTIVDNGGNVLFNNTVPISNGQVSFTIPFTVNVSGPVIISAVDVYNSSIGGTATVNVEPWNVTFSFATNGTVWQYLNNELYVTVHVNGPSVPVNVTIGGNSYLNVVNGQVLTYDIIVPQGTFNITTVAAYNGHVVGGPVNYTVSSQVWNATICVSPSMFYWGISGTLTACAEPTNGVPLAPSDLMVTLDTNYGTNTTPGSTSLSIINPTNNVTGTVKVYYEAGRSLFLINSTSINIPVENWSKSVAYAPHELYYLPNGYTNEPLVVNVSLGLPANVAQAANVTICAKALLGNVTLAKTTVNGTNMAQINLGAFTFNQSGTVTLVVKVVDPATGFVLYLTNYTIPIKLALNATVSPQVAYVNIPFNLDVNVTTVSSSPDITVQIAGTNYTATATSGGVIEIPNVVLSSPGTYTVVIHDASLNATIERTFTVRDWHIAVSVNPNVISAGSVYMTNFTIKLVDSTGAIVPVNDRVTLVLDFSNTSVIPAGFYKWTVPVTNGVGSVIDASIFAPVAGTFLVNVTDEYGKANTTQTITVNPPNPADLTYIYVNIREQGSLNPPGVPVKLYWGLEIGGVRKYFPVYNPTYNSDYSEAMFTLYPQQSFDLYIIAAPQNVSFPILVEGQNYTWTVTLVNISKTWYTVNKTVTVTPLTRGWDIMVNVSKYEMNYVNISNITYSYTVTNVPGVIQIVPGSSSVQGNAIYTGITETPHHYENFTVTLVGSATNETIIKIEPNNLTLKLCDNTTLKPTQAGEYFTFKAKLSITNAEQQFDAQWMPFEQWIENISFLNTTEKMNITDQILSEIGNVSAMNGPVPNETIYFHISNTSIAYVEPTSAVTDANGTVEFRVYTVATANMTPQQLESIMGAVSVWATYDNLTTSPITVNFGGAGAISGDITDNTGRQIPGVTVVVKYWNGSAWVNATDFNGNVLKTVSASDGHYAISNVPAAVNGTKYMVEAIYGNYTGYAYVTVYPFITSTADIKLSGTVSSGNNSTMNTTSMGFSEYPSMVDNASNVFVVFNNYGTADAFSVSTYMSQTIHNTHVHYLPVSSFNMSYVNASDVIISVGGPLVNPITAMYENISKAKMVVNGTTILVETPNETFTWVPPKPWWNVTEGYFIIEMFKDNTTGAIVVTIYGTDASSTAAGAYYFANVIYPNIAAYQNVTTIVGKWINTNNASVPVFVYPDGTPLNFDPSDTIQIVYEG